MSTEVSTKLTTGVVKLSYAKIWAPESMNEGEDKKYSCAILIPKKDKATIAKAEAIIEALRVAKFPKEPLKKLKFPLRDGDEEKPDDPNYAGMMFFNATSKSKPGIVDKSLNAILDQDEVYSGCFAVVAVNFYSFEAKGNKGIAVGLNSIMKVKDGERLAGGSNPVDDFKDVDTSAFDDDDSEDWM